MAAQRTGPPAIDKPALLASARKVLESEAQAIYAASARLDGNLIQAVDLILNHPGKVIVSGLGKSGYVARKLAATFQSTGTPSVYLHPGEAAHGDLGVCQTRDPVVMVSKSGTTSELMGLLAPLREFRSPLIGILGNRVSPLAEAMDVVLDASVQREADPHGFTPTASSVVALAIGHALAVTLMEARGFSAVDFARLHAGGQLGRNLRLCVNDVMHRGAEVAWAAPSEPLKRVVIEMSHHPLGAACVVAPDYTLLGLITDGDVRRALEQHDDIRALRAEDIMTRSPVTVSPQSLVHDALRRMEDRPSQISVLPVLDSAGHRCLGLVRLHDLYTGMAG
ncbi:MAG: KpsF/GutQ family sugar-phosphate isomerase [Bryobacterales bacterium]|nr:KpsF/GutQ family sugar-phosphate isomerase [Bryobacterales bacterium]